MKAKDKSILDTQIKIEKLERIEIPFTTRVINRYLEKIESNKKMSPTIISLDDISERLNQLAEDIKVLIDKANSEMPDGVYAYVGMFTPRHESKISAYNKAVSLYLTILPEKCPKDVLQEVHEEELRLRPLDVEWDRKQAEQTRQNPHKYGVYFPMPK